MPDTQALATATHQHFLRLRDRLGESIIGQRALVSQLLIALLATGICWWRGLPAWRRRPR